MNIYHKEKQPKRATILRAGGIIFLCIWMTVLLHQLLLGALGPLLHIILAQLSISAISMMFIYLIFLKPLYIEHAIEVKILLDRATIDELTKLPNRHSIILKTTKLMDERRKQYRCCMIIDLDKFKPINDNYGHDTGDAALVIVSDALRSIKENYSFRLGGDEFFIITGELGFNKDEAAKLAHLKALKVLSRVSQQFEIGGHKFSLSASIGGYLIAPDDKEADQLLRKSDVAMYYAKKLKTPKFHLYDINEKRR